MIAALRAIVIRPDPFSTRYDVEIVPPATDGPCHDRDFAELGQARAYASGLQAVTGFPVHDLCEPANGQG